MDSRDLTAALGSAVLGIHHVGSTSVPGLAAKPILDVLVGVPDLEAALDLVTPLERLGYRFHSGEDTPDRHYFRRWAQPGIRTHHLSLAEPTSEHYLETLAFRDTLRGDRDLAAEYGRLKQNLARDHSGDRKAYLAGKSAFIRKVLGSD